MRENRTYGSEGGEAWPPRPLSIVIAGMTRLLHAGVTRGASSRKT